MTLNKAEMEGFHSVYQQMTGRAADYDAVLGNSWNFDTSDAPQEAAAPDHVRLGGYKNGERARIGFKA